MKYFEKKRPIESESQKSLIKDMSNLRTLKEEITALFDDELTNLISDAKITNILTYNEKLTSFNGYLTQL